MNIRKNLWIYKYQPKTFEDIIVNDEIKPKLKKAIEEIPNMLLYGTPGIGKGCFANILKNKENIDYMWINASDENGIDVFRNKITPFATAMCMKDMKIVILNEADSLTSGQQGSQKLLRQLMEDTNKICRFIFLCNYDNNIIPELKSRCGGYVIKMDNPPKKEIGKLCLKILKKENVKYETKDVLDIIKKCYPDIRKTIDVLQSNVINGKLTGSKVHESELLFDKIFKFILDKNIESVREELRSNYISYENLYEYIFNNIGEFKQPGQAILEVAEHLHRNVTTPIKEINFIRMVTRLIYVKAL